MTELAIRLFSLFFFKCMTFQFGEYCLRPADAQFDKNYFKKEIVINFGN